MEFRTELNYSVLTLYLRKRGDSSSPRLTVIARTEAVKLPVTDRMFLRLVQIIIIQRGRVESLYTIFLLCLLLQE
jgi:hypothetical protein